MRSDLPPTPPRQGNVSGTLSYGAVIRAYQYTPLLAQVVDALKKQSISPNDIIIVDSSSDAATTRNFEALATIVVPYPETMFNYSKALNIGHLNCRHEFVLNISSHMLIRATDVIEAGWRSGSAKGAEVVSWFHHPAVADEERHVLVDRRRFNGFNGMSNAMCLIPTRLVKSRPFREEVFAAEDQEWTKHYLATQPNPVLIIETQRVEYLNPNHGSDNWNQLKLLNDEIAVGYYVNRRVLGPDRIAMRCLRALMAACRFRPERARVHLAFAWALAKANFARPVRSSRYF